MLDAAKTTFRKSTLYACPTPFFSAIGQMLKKNSGMPTMYFRLKIQRRSILIGSDIIEMNRNTHDVVPGGAHLLVVRLEQGLRENHRQGEDVEQHEQDPEDLAHQPERGQPGPEAAAPRRTRTG